MGLISARSWNGHRVNATVVSSSASTTAASKINELLTEEGKVGSGLRGIVDRVVERSGKPNPTLGDFVTYSRRGTINEFPVFCGTPARVADQMQEWFEAEACDGFVVAATHVPGGYEDFVRLVVPELQRRGVFRREFAGATLRDNLGLPRAGIGDWR